MGIFWKFTSPLGISVGAVIRLNYRIAVGRGHRLWVGWRRSEIGHCATVAKPIYAPESCRSLEMDSWE